MHHTMNAPFDDSSPSPAYSNIMTNTFSDANSAYQWQSANSAPCLAAASFSCSAAPPTDAACPPQFPVNSVPHQTAEDSVCPDSGAIIANRFHHTESEMASAALDSRSDMFFMTPSSPDQSISRSSDPPSGAANHVETSSVGCLPPNELRSENIGNVSCSPSFEVTPNSQDVSDSFAEPHCQSTIPLVDSCPAFPDYSAPLGGGWKSRSSDSEYATANGNRSTLLCPGLSRHNSTPQFPQKTHMKSSTSNRHNSQFNIPVSQLSYTHPQNSPVAAIPFIPPPPPKLLTRPLHQLPIRQPPPPPHTSNVPEVTDSLMKLHSIGQSSASRSFSNTVASSRRTSSAAVDPGKRIPSTSATTTSAGKSSSTQPSSAHPKRVIVLKRPNRRQPHQTSPTTASAATNAAGLPDAAAANVGSDNSESPAPSPEACDASAVKYPPNISSTLLGPTKTLEEREHEYKEVRKRIFGDSDVDASQPASENSTSIGADSTENSLQPKSRENAGITHNSSGSNSSSYSGSLSTNAASSGPSASPPLNVPQSGRARPRPWRNMSLLSTTSGVQQQYCCPPMPLTHPAMRMAGDPSLRMYPPGVGGNSYHHFPPGAVVVPPPPMPSDPYYPFPPAHFAATPTALGSPIATAPETEFRPPMTHNMMSMMSVSSNNHHGNFTHRELPLSGFVQSTDTSIQDSYRPRFYQDSAATTAYHYAPFQLPSTMQQCILFPTDSPVGCQQHLPYFTHQESCNDKFTFNADSFYPATQLAPPSSMPPYAVSRQLPSSPLPPGAIVERQHVSNAPTSANYCFPSNIG